MHKHFLCVVLITKTNLNIHTHQGLKFLSSTKRIKWINITQQWEHATFAIVFRICYYESSFSREGQLALANKSFIHSTKKSQAVNLFPIVCCALPFLLAYGEGNFCLDCHFPLCCNPEVQKQREEINVNSYLKIVLIMFVTRGSTRVQNLVIMGRESHKNGK